MLLTSGAWCNNISTFDNIFTQSIFNKNILFENGARYNNTSMFDNISIQSIFNKNVLFENDFKRIIYKYFFGKQ